MVNRNRWNKSTERLPAKSEIRVVSVMWGSTGFVVLALCADFLDRVGTSYELKLLFLHMQVA